MEFKHEGPIWVVRTTLKGWAPELYVWNYADRPPGLAVYSTAEAAEESAATLRHNPERSADVEQHTTGDLGKLLAERPVKGIWFDDQWFAKWEVLGRTPE